MKKKYSILCFSFNYGYYRSDWVNCARSIRTGDE